MKSQEIDENMALNGYEKVSNLKFEKTDLGINRQVIFNRSSLDSSFKVHAYIKGQSSGELLKFGGIVSPASVDYLDFSFYSDEYKKWSDFENVFSTVIQEWFNRLAYSIFDSEVSDTQSLREKTELVNTGGKIEKHIPTTRSVLVEEGFQEVVKSDSVIFHRNKSGIFDVVCIDSISQGVFVAVRAIVWMPELQVFGDNLVDSPANIDHLMNVNGGFIHSENMLQPRPSAPLNLSSVETNKQLDTEISKCVGSLEEIFFSKINSKADLLDSMFPEYKRSSYFSHLFGDSTQ